MVAFLLDTMVLSELRRRERDAGVVGWIEAQRPSDLYLQCRDPERDRARHPASAPDQPAIRRGAGELDGQDPSDLQRPVAPGRCRRGAPLGILSGELGHAGADLLIAATALEHGLTVVTKNLRHFVPTGVEVLDPFATGD